ncbi:MAG: hypothetical protein R2711_17400 [Acidimicrobiales bacterium]
MGDVPVIDAWVNIFPESFAARWASKDEQQGVVQLFGPDLAKGPPSRGSSSRWTRPGSRPAC